MLSGSAFFEHKDWNSRGSVVKVMDLNPVNLGSTPAGTHMSHWWIQEGSLSKIAPMHQL